MITKNKLVLLILLTSLLNSCTKNIGTPLPSDEIQKDNRMGLKTKQESIGKNIQENLKQYKEDKDSGKKINVNNKCIGCWKCVMSDPKHFKVNMGTFTPDIISQEDIFTVSTKNAIEICPVDAISIS